MHICMRTYMYAAEAVASGSGAAHGAKRRVRALLLTKTARWRLMQPPASDSTAPHSASDPIDGRVQGTGYRHSASDPIDARVEAMQLACATHERAVRAVREAMHGHGFEIRSQDARAAVPEDTLGWADICMALGVHGHMHA